MLADQKLRTMPPTEVRRVIDQQIVLEERRLGLDRPFMLRSFTYLRDALTLSLGRAERLTSDKGSRQVRDIISSGCRLLCCFSGPRTSSFSLWPSSPLFFCPAATGACWTRRWSRSLPPLRRQRGFTGSFLILIFASLLRVLPFGGMVDVPPPESALAYGLSVLQHLILPVIGDPRRLALHIHLQLADLFPHLLQRRLRRSSQSQGIPREPLSGATFSGQLCRPLSRASPLL